MTTSLSRFTTAAMIALLGLPLQAADPGVPKIHTIHDEVLSARPLRIEEGRLVVETNPPRQIPLDEIARIEWTRSGPLGATWVGQVNRDVARAADSGAAIQDVCLVVSGIHPARSIRRLEVSGGGTVWKMDTAETSTPEGPANAQPRGVAGLIAGLLNSAMSGGKTEKPLHLAVQHSPGTDTAEVYLEPPRGDLFGKSITLSLAFDDESVASAAVKAATHTKADLKVGEVATATESPAAVQQAVVYLDGGDRIAGELLAIEGDSLRVRSRLAAELKVAMSAVRGIAWSAAPGTEAGDLVFKHLATRGADDVAVALTKDQTPSSVAGRVESYADGKLQFAFEGQTRTISQARLVGIVLAARPAASRWELHQTVQTLSGDVLSGHWTGLEGESLKLKPHWGGDIAIPIDRVSSITVRNGKLAFLSDLEPVQAEEVPYFSRTWPYQRDKSLLGEPLRIKGQTYAKGLAVHARSLLTYDLAGEYRQFKAVLGFDDAAGGRGRAACRVLGDGRVLFENADLRGSAEPVPLDLPIAGVKQLTLEVDFGEEEDIGDRLLWASARVVR
jgi:hypothetical protein